MNKSDAESSSDAFRLAMKGQLRQLRAILSRLDETRSSFEREIRSLAYDFHIDPPQPLVTLRDRELADRAKTMLAARRWRDEVFQAPDLFGEPAWDILLDLYVSWADNRGVSISDAALASAGAPTTALRYIAQLEKKGWVERSYSDSDSRRVLLRLTGSGLILLRKALQRH